MGCRSTVIVGQRRRRAAASADAVPACARLVASIQVMFDVVKSGLSRFLPTTRPAHIFT
jgi:hypothetical protein